jgi:hypothetical protein
MKFKCTLDERGSANGALANHEAVAAHDEGGIWVDRGADRI